MRLDLYLKASRLCARRTVAQKFCDAARVSVNGHTAKSSHAVKVGDEIAINRHHSLITVRVLDIPEARQTSRKQAGMLYELVSEESLAQDDLVKNSEGKPAFRTIT
jgi:ribosomal 50S subunit-recycling heat shock protein